MVGARSWILSFNRVWVFNVSPIAPVRRSTVPHGPADHAVCCRGALRSRSRSRMQGFCHSEGALGNFGPLSVVARANPLGHAEGHVDGATGRRIGYDLDRFVWIMLAKAGHAMVVASTRRIPHHWSHRRAQFKSIGGWTKSPARSVLHGHRA